MIRTRFAPSPTGYLHIGGARTALFCWAYAKKHGGKFILRVEDTDLERSTQQSVQAILDGMQWLGLDCDEGPFYQMQRLARYKEVAQQLLDTGHAYYCYCSKEEIEAMRVAQRARGEKPRYDGRWRDSTATPPAGVTPVLRFKTPLTGDVTWDDQVKGWITISNDELDDLVLLRGDGVPTYNFGVVVDDIDMNITNVIRGDDHVNNTPRQINIYKALGVPLPRFAHLPMILGHDGERLSKRHGAVSVMQYRDDGFLPEALVNYLARLGWSHGDEEKFSREQLVEWFDLAHVSKSPARFDHEKLRWLNQQYIKEADSLRLAELVAPFLAADMRVPAEGPPTFHIPPLRDVIELLRTRAGNLRELAEAAVLFCKPLSPSDALRQQHYTMEVKPAMLDLHERFNAVVWNRAAINDVVKGVVAAHGLKMPKLAMPLRVMVTGQTQTPSIDATLELIGKESVLARMSAELKHFPG
jgi:glutamyl-tRNA synthetase